jgi:hypothetical protein
LWIVPVKVQGSWRLPQGELTLKQHFQDLSGTFNAGGDSVPIFFGRLRGNEIGFTAGDTEYTGRVDGSVMQGTAMRGGASTAWNAIRTTSF